MNFSDFIADRAKDFTGWEWVFAPIDTWLADPYRPTFDIITSGPVTG